MTLVMCFDFLSLETSLPSISEFINSPCSPPKIQQVQIVFQIGVADLEINESKLRKMSPMIFQFLQTVLG